MTEVTFKYRAGAKAVDKHTGLTGVIQTRIERINGCLQYGIQPPVTEKDPHVIPSAYYLDEDIIDVAEGPNPESYMFKFETGDRVKSLVSGAEGIIVARMLDSNGCERYQFNGKLDKDGKETDYGAFAQEIVLIDKGLNISVPATPTMPAREPIKRARTGGPAQSFTNIQTVR